MGISFSLLLIAAGAILTFAVQDNVAELDLAAIGWVMMVVGIIGLLFSLLFWSSVAPFGESIGYRRRQTAGYVDDAPSTRRTVIDEYDEAPPVRRRTVVDDHTQDHPH